jgi:H+/Cl- antiporter ClcA
MATAARGDETATPDTARDREEIRQLVVFSCFGVGMGILGAVSAWLLYHLINIFTGFAYFHRFTTQSPLYPPAQGLGIMALIVPIIGGLLVGVMAKYGTDRIRGHGIPEAMEAVLKNKSRVGVRVAIFKPISAAIAVGSGGPFGAEGPIIQTGGALGSLIGQTMKMTAKERRILLACGGAAGMVGIFNTPIAGVALALELLLFEFRARSLIPVIIASGVAAACRTVLLGSAPMFNIGTFPGIGGPLDLLWFVPLGIIVGVGSVIISKLLYIIEEFFDHLNVDLLFKPALGAVVLGLVALFQPRVLGMGYTYITDVLRNQYSVTTLISLGVGKTIALVASLGAGTSGGLLAPMLLIGATLGSGYGRGIHALVPAAGINPGICAIVAMSSLFSAAARAPLTSFIFAFELTGDYHAILPLMIGCMIADIVSRSLSRESVMTERLVRRGLRVDQGYETRLLNFLNVGEVMTRAMDTLAERTPLRVAVKALLGEPMAISLLQVYGIQAGVTSALTGATNGHADVSGGMGFTSRPDASDEASGDVCALGLRAHWAFPVVDAGGKLSGIVTRGELLTAANDPARLEQPVSEFTTKRVVVCYRDESLDTALMRMLAGDYQLMPVVDRDDPRTLLGVLSRQDILRAWRLRDLDETQRERIINLRRRRATVIAAPAGPRTAEDGDRHVVDVTTVPEETATSLFERNIDTLTLPGEEQTREDAREKGGVAGHVSSLDEK